MTASMLAPHGVGYDPLRDKSYQATGLGRDVVDYLTPGWAVGA